MRISDWSSDVCSSDLWSAVTTVPPLMRIAMMVVPPVPCASLVGSETCPFGQFCPMLRGEASPLFGIQFSVPSFSYMGPCQRSWQYGHILLERRHGGAHGENRKSVGTGKGG